MECICIVRCTSFCIFLVLYFNTIAMGHMRMSSKIFIQVDFSGSKLKALQAKVNLKNDTCEKQPKRAHLLYNGHMLYWQ